MKYNYEVDIVLNGFVFYMENEVSSKQTLPIIFIIKKIISRNLNGVQNMLFQVKIQVSEYFWLEI